MRITPLCLLLAACSTSSPSTYGQMAPGAPVSSPPRAPAFNPTLDAPHTTGQPGFLEPRDYPRGEDKRVLPPTREPWIWASDVPQHPPGLKRTITFGSTDYEYPLPEEASIGEMDRAEACARASYRAAYETNILSLVESMQMIDRRCVLSKLFEVCAKYGIDKTTKVSTETGRDTSYSAMCWARVKMAASTDARNACSLVEDFGKLNPAIKSMSDALDHFKDDFVTH